MWNVIINRCKQGFRTLPYPEKAPSFPQRFRGLPVLRVVKQEAALSRDKDPLGAVSAGQSPVIDMGKMTFNENLKNVFPEGIFTYSREYRLAAAKREDLLIGENESLRAFIPDKKIKKIFNRSFKLRHVSAGGCGGCEAETSVIQIVVFDLYRFGISYVSSPRHADGLIVTGPVTKNMAFALRETYAAMPEPKIVIAAGTCAISGGPFQGSSEVYNGVDTLIPVDLYIPGCPPHPLTILDGLLCVMDRLKKRV
jgi:Ni,Fe-hydrogenase III small subunit